MNWSMRGLISVFQLGVRVTFSEENDLQENAGLQEASEA
jgi:hypothetical protein